VTTESSLAHEANVNPIASTGQVDTLVYIRSFDE